MPWSMKKIFSANASKDSLLRVVYFINLFLGGIVFLDIASVFVDALVMVWAVFIFCNKLKRKSLANIPYKRLILLFLLFSVITIVVVNLHIGSLLYFIADFIMIYHAAICFFLFYGACSSGDFAKIKSEAMLIFKVIVVLTAVFTMLSFVVLLFADSITVMWDMPIIEKYWHIIGIIKGTDSGRFTGVFINPNILAFSSVISIIFCHMLYRSSEFLPKSRRGIQVLVAIALVTMDLIALVLSDSIASFLFLLCYIAIWLFYRLIIETRAMSIKLMLKRGFAFFLACTGVILGLFSIRSCLQSGASNAIDEIYSVIARANNNLNLDDDIRFGRPNHNIRDGSGRRRLLEQSMVIFSKHPLLGIGNANIYKYGNLYFDSGIAFPNFHNGYVSVLVCNGLVGFALFIAFLALNVIRLIQVLFVKATKLQGTIFANLLCAILSYLIFALFEKTMLSEINLMGVFFWLMLGYAMVFVPEK